jgi:hypothetical protein
MSCHFRPAPGALADAAGAGSVCADAIAVAPNNEATTRAEIASLQRLIRKALGVLSSPSKVKATKRSVRYSHGISLLKCV